MEGSNAPQPQDQSASQVDTPCQDSTITVAVITTVVFGRCARSATCNPFFASIASSVWAIVLVDDHDPPAHRPIAPRRKFRRDLDMCLLKEVQANAAHVPAHGETIPKFAEVATKLNPTNVLPWVTDGKHCQDRLNIIVQQWCKRTDISRQRPVAEKTSANMNSCALTSLPK